MPNITDALSAREKQVFNFIAVGTPPAEMASRLCLSPKTVSTYRARILEKLGLQSNAQIAVAAREQDTRRLLALLDRAKNDFAILAAQTGHDSEAGKFALLAFMRIEENLRVRSES